MAGFSASISAWSERAKRNMLAIAQQSAQDLAEHVTTSVYDGGNMPVDTGFLRNSLQVSLYEMPLISAQAFGGSREVVSLDLSGPSATILGAEPGQTIFMGFTAAYAAKMEETYGFVADGAQNWNRIVQENARKIV